MIQGTTEEPVRTNNLARQKTAASGRGAFLRFGIVAGVLLLGFSKVLWGLLAYGIKTDVHSHILLVPFVSGYLVWQLRGQLPQPRQERSALSAVLLVLGVLTLGTYLALRFGLAVRFSRNDGLSFTVLAFCLLFTGVFLHFLGKNFARTILFPLLFLFFLVPFPDALTDLLETGSKYASAEVYAWMMSLSGATYFREGLVFVLPGISIRVAQECSGIRSSLVLFITSLIAGHMFLRSPWKKTGLALVVFPLGVLRNAFRIYVLSMLSVHWNREVIDSPLHHQGGPIFFALSLIPFFLFLLWLRKHEQVPVPFAGLIQDPTKP
jgi:exosortase C (VPDSG-CTERM-specific)